VEGVEQLVETLADSPWVYVVLSLSIAGSAVLPPLPSDSVLVTAMGLAATGELALGWVCVATTAAGWVGDQLAYGVGRLLQDPARRRAGRAARAEAALGWLEGHARAWGPGLVVVGRFVPGGTTAVGLSAGVLGYPWRRFASLAAVGALLWTGYGAVVGYVGASVFPGNLWAGLALGLAVVLVAGPVFHLAVTRRRP
jgi:membrane-associated protein